jgi:hypothetical protein
MRVNIMNRRDRPLTGRARILARHKDVLEANGVFSPHDRRRLSDSGTTDRGDAIPPSAGSGGCRPKSPQRLAASSKLPANHFWLCLGNQIKNVVPTPGRVSKEILPSCPSTHDFAMDKPSPVPVRFS